MKTISVSNPKGGSGKTTLLTNLACFYAHRGYQVIILDADTQYSARDWASARPDTLPKIQVIASTTHKLVGQLKEIQAIKPEHTLILIDLPASFPVETALQLFEHCDGVLIPMLPSPVDVWALVRHLFNLYKHFFESGTQMKTAVIANRMRAHGLLQRQVLDHFLKRIRFPLICELRDTQNYSEAIGEGKGICELPHSKSGKDIQQWESILLWVDKEILTQSE